jgi:hypothetical protein
MERFHCVLFAKFDRLTRRQGDLFRSLVASPNVFAVLRLMTRSNFVGCSTPTWSPARRNRSGTFGPYGGARGIGSGLERSPKFLSSCAVGCRGSRRNRASQAQLHFERKRMGKEYKPGDTVEHSGVYLVLHDEEHTQSHEVTVVFGKRFPACNHCGHHPRFIAVRLEQHIDHNEHFK